MKLQQGPLPLYFQLAKNLESRIRSGELPGGDMLPTEQQLGEEFGVSRITVRRAVDDLIAQQLVERRRGVGTFVARPPAQQKMRAFAGSLHESLRFVQNLQYVQITRHIVEAPPAIMQAFGIESEKAKVLVLKGVGRQPEGPVTVSEIFIPPALQAMVGKGEEFGRPILRMLESKLGQRCTRAEELVEAEIADAATAKKLDIPAGSAVLRVLRCFYLADGRPVEAVVVRYHPRRYKLHLELVERPDRLA